MHADMNLRQEWIIKVRKMAKIKNRYNQAPHLTKDTNIKAKLATIFIFALATNKLTSTVAFIFNLIGCFFTCEFTCGMIDITYWHSDILVSSQIKSVAISYLHRS